MDSPLPLISIRDFVTHDCAPKRFDHGGAGELPLRGDVRALMVDYLFNPDSSLSLSVKWLNKLKAPSVKLLTDGTIELCYERHDRELILHVQCGHAVTYIKSYEDAATEVAGTIRFRWALGNPQINPQEFDDLFAWLWSGVSP